MKIHICFATNDRYAPHAAALICSIMDNKSPDDQLAFYFFSDKTTQPVKAAFRKMSSEMGFELTIYEMSDEQFADFPLFMGSRTTYFRLSMHRMLPAELKKILYLDCDMIVTSSLEALYATDISDHYAAVVAEATRVPHLPVVHAYFNAGMVLFNLEKFRNEDLETQAIKFGYEHPDWIRFADQEILNYIFRGEVIYLPLKWNMMLEKFHLNNLLLIGYEVYPFSGDEFSEANTNPKIIHFVTGKKPWHVNCESAYKSLYWKYARKTPFYGEVCKQYRKDYLQGFLPLFKVSISRRRISVKICGREMLEWRFRQETESEREA